MLASLGGGDDGAPVTAGHTDALFARDMLGTKARCFPSH